MGQGSSCSTSFPTLAIVGILNPDDDKSLVDKGGGENIPGKDRACGEAGDERMLHEGAAAHSACRPCGGAGLGVRVLESRR